MSPSAKKIEELSRQLARAAGLRLRPPEPRDFDYAQAGWLRGLLPEDFFHWRKCPFHDTWLQAELAPFVHWRCQAKDFCKGHQCTFARPAKLRTRAERRIFAVARFLEENG